MFTPLPKVDKFNSTTSIERIIALREGLEFVGKKGGLATALAGSGPVDVSELIEVSDYILTGHKYSDTHDLRDETDFFGKAIDDEKERQEEPEIQVVHHIVDFNADVTGLDPESADIVIDAAANAALKKHMKRERKRAEKAEQNKAESFSDE